MSFEIGSVQIDDTYYSDGDIEDEYIAIAKNSDFETVLKKDNRWQILYHFSDIRENLLEWYPFSKNGTTLEIGAGCGAMTGLLCRKTEHVTSVELSIKRSHVNAYRNKDCDNLKIVVGNFEDIEPSLGNFDYITLIGVWEYSASYISSTDPYRKMLSIALKHLKPNGNIFIAIENKMGIKYWNGAVEDHTGVQFLGLRNYVDTDKVRTFSKPEIETMLRELSVKNYSFYYPMPDYKLPNVIYSDQYLPKPGSERNYGKDYSGKRQYLFNDALIMDQLCKDNVFPYFANSFLVILGKNSSDMVFTKYNRLRKLEYRTKIVISGSSNKGKIVQRFALCNKAQNHIINLSKNEHFCERTNTALLQTQGSFENNCYNTQYIARESMCEHLYNHIFDVDYCVSLLRKFSRVILKNSQEMSTFAATDQYREWFGENYPMGKCHIKSEMNVDMSVDNIKLMPHGKFCLIDYEWVLPFPVPLEYVIWRTCAFFYVNDYSAYLNKRIDINVFLQRVGVNLINVPVFEKMEQAFLEKILGKDYNEAYILRYVCK